MRNQCNVRRQDEREADGRYKASWPCELCGRPAGDNYYSHRCLDESLGGYGLVLCKKCAGVLEYVMDATALAALVAASAARSSGNPLPFDSRGRFYVACIEDAWQVVDSRHGLTVSKATRFECELTKRFFNQYVDLWGDIDFNSLPYGHEEPFRGRETEQ